MKYILYAGNGTFVVSYDRNLIYSNDIKDAKLFSSIDKALKKANKINEQLGVRMITVFNI